jgi:hypothetical protein
MPSPTTALAIISTALRNIGVLATGETPTADQVSDALAALNDVLETWSTQSLAVYGGAVETFAGSVGQASYSIGLTGTWITDRPVRVDGAFATINGVDFPIEIIGLDQYNDIAVKSTQGIPEQLCYVNDFPNALIYLYPVPPQTIAISLDLPRLLTAIADASTVVNLPPGYARALQWAVAVEIAPQYGIDVTPMMMASGRSAVASIKRANRVPVLSAYDVALTNPPGAIWQRGW